MFNSLHHRKMRGGVLLSICISLLALISCSSGPSADALTISIDNAFNVIAKTVTYDGSLTGGERDINAYRVLITDSVGTLVADSGLFSSDELTLTGIAAGSYTATLQGVINGGGESVVVAENEYPITVKGGDRLSMTLDSVAEGVAGEVALSVDFPVLLKPIGTYWIDFDMVFDYASGNDGEPFYEWCSYNFGDSDIICNKDGWHVDMLLEEGTIPSGNGVLEITLNTDNQTYSAVASFCLYPDMKAVGDIDFRVGSGTVKPEWKMVNTPEYGWDSVDSIAYGNGKFLAAYDNAGEVGFIESTDGINWIKTNSGESFHRGQTMGLKFIHDRFITDSSAPMWSFDGIEWQDADTAIRYADALGYGNGLWYSVHLPGSTSSPMKVYLSKDFLSWSELSIPNFDGFDDATWFLLSYMVIGESLYIITDNNIVIKASLDGYQVTDLTGMGLEIISNIFSDIVDMRSFFIGNIPYLIVEGDLVGSGSNYSLTFYSLDECKTWKLYQANSGLFMSNPIASSPVGIAITYDSHREYFTFDGLNWYDGYAELSTLIGRISYADEFGIKFSDDRFIACGEDGIAYWIPEAS